MYNHHATVTFLQTEIDLITTVVDLVKKHDADILVGFEVKTLSWGYLVQRAAQLNINLPNQLSRFVEQTVHHKSTKQQNSINNDVIVNNNNNNNNINNNNKNYDGDDEDIFGDVKIPGRIVLNLWKILKHEIALNIYTFENLAFHVLHRRYPHFSHHTLTSWFQGKARFDRWKTLDYYTVRSVGNLQIMEKLNIIDQTSEFARIYGIEFFNVLNRGSQYRVESMMLRLAKPKNFIAVSPGIHQRAAMKSMECIPLNLEPRSDFYTDPVVVLDFQSLYPSIMIAHNYCFSTCLGRIKSIANCRDGPFEFGCTSLYIPKHVLKSLKYDDINVCSNGIAFVKQHIRKGVISQMVEEILNTRIMVKKAMKVHKNDKGLQRTLHARQLGLKLIANVTFGYTAASFSGRMACVEIGDSIVRKARDTLEQAIRLVEQTEKWAAQVIYGDTDSMFVLLRGRTRQQAFVVGQEIADAVTNSNPRPVTLKLEKVYMPCVLQTKKRYVGFMYETADQQEPTFHAKGIETVRRDNCPAVSKILERSLKTLFTSCDISLVKKYVQRQCIKILEERTPLRDFIFAKEYRGMAGYQPTACIPALEIARRRLARDRRSEPLVGQRVPYVIIFGTPGLPLIKLVREPGELLSNSNLRVNYTYYLMKQILPPINRFAMLFGLDAFHWYDELPRVLKVNSRIFNPVLAITSRNNQANDRSKHSPVKSSKLVNENLTKYFTSVDCPICGQLTNAGMCELCKTDDRRRVLISSCRIRKVQARQNCVNQICNTCKGWIDAENSCDSLDCPILYKDHRLKSEAFCLDALFKVLDFEF